MENKKDIGKAISDKLGSLDKTPRDQVWSDISYELQKKKKRRGAFFFFWAKTIGFVLLGAIAALYIYDRNSDLNLFSPDKAKETITVNDSNVTGKNSSADSNNNENSKTNNDETVTANGVTTDGTNPGNENSTFGEKTTTVNNKNIGSKTNSGLRNRNSTDDGTNKRSRNVLSKSERKSNSNSVSSKSSKNNSILSSKSKNTSAKEWAKNSKATKSDEKTDSKNGIKSLDNVDSKSVDTNAPITDLSALQGKTSTEKEAELKEKKKDSLIANKEKETNTDMHPKDSVKKDSAKTPRKFYVDAFVSPTLYGYLVKESALDRDLDSLSKKSDITFGYGFGLSYDLTERVSIRIGYRKTYITYLTKNAPIGINMPGSDNFTGILYNPEVSNTSIYIASDGSETMDITQKISYTEIPLEVKYNFLTKKLGLKSSFGFSYLMLDENKISIKTLSGYTQDIGKTKNLSSISVSVNFGLEMDYPIFRNMKVFAEPMFNYQLKSFSDNNFKPYTFGVNLGLRYGF